MRIQLTTDRVTLLGRERRGDVIDVPDADAANLISSHQAVAAPDSPVTRAVNVQTTIETNMLQPAVEFAGGRKHRNRR